MIEVIKAFGYAALGGFIMWQVNRHGWKKFYEGRRDYKSQR